jgi:hypothetical protein
MNTRPEFGILGEQLSLLDIVPTKPVRPLPPNPRSLAGNESDQGGWFDYERSPEVFLGRSGRGPLRVAWDTNILVDYGCFGGAMWSDDLFDPPIKDDEYRANLVALQALMELWLVRDIRIHVFDRQLTDSRRQLPAERLTARMRQVEEIVAALQCLSHDTDDWEPDVDEAMPVPCSLGWMEPGADRELLEGAIDAGCHVFLTRDHDDVLRHAPVLEAYWLAPLSPADLLDRLVSAGEFTFATASAFCIPDSHKWGHVMAACNPV